VHVVVAQGLGDLKAAITRYCPDLKGLGHHEESASNGIEVTISEFKNRPRK
jgi:hypothetical protein